MDEQFTVKEFFIINAIMRSGIIRGIDNIIIGRNKGVKIDNCAIIGESIEISCFIKTIISIID